MCISGEKSIPGKANSKCKGPEAEVCLKCSRNRELEHHNHGVGGGSSSLDQVVVCAWKVVSRGMV